MGVIAIQVRDETRSALYTLKQKANASQAGVGKVTYSDVIDTVLDIVKHIDGLSEAEVLEGIVIAADRN